MVVRLENEIHPLADEQVHDVRPDRAGRADERDAVFVHAYDYPLDAPRSGLVYRVGRPVVVRASGAVGVGALTGECEIRRDIDEPGQRRTGRIVEVVLLAVCAAQSSELVRKTGREFSDLTVRAIILMVAGDQFHRKRASHALLDEIAPGRLGRDVAVAEVAYR